MPGSHTGEALKTRLEVAIQNWGLQQEKLTAIVSDNAANIVNAIGLLKWPRVPCIAHTLQLSLRPEKRVIQDVVTRWNSTYDMLVSVLESRKAIVHELSQSEDLLSYLPSLEEWDMAIQLVWVLGPFKQATRELDDSNWQFQEIHPSRHQCKGIKLAISIVCSIFPGSQIQEIGLDLKICMNRPKQKKASVHCIGGPHIKKSSQDWLF